MPKRIDRKILQAEIKQRIREFYPFFLGFYVLSLAVAFFSSAWSGFFYWPAFHGAIIIFTVLFLLITELDLRGSYLSRHIPILKKFRILRAVPDLGDKKMSRHVNILNKIRSAMTLATESFVVVNRFASHSFKEIVCSIKEKIRIVPRRTWAKIMVIAALLVLAHLKGIGIIDFLVLLYALVSFLFIFDSRWSAAAALLLLASCPVLLILKKDPWAENVAIYAYYFLVITVLTQIMELRRGRTAVDNSVDSIVVNEKT